MSKFRRDYLRIVEAIYAPAADDQAWLQQIVDAADKTFDLGRGVAAYTYVTRDDGFELGSFAADPIHAQRLLSTSHEISARDPNTLRLAHAKLPRVETAAQVHAAWPDAEGWKLLQASGVGDALAIKAHDASGFGCALITASAELIEVSPRTRGALERVAAHLGAGLRLRRRAPESIDDADAVFNAHGEVEHVRAEAGSRALLEREIERRKQGQALRQVEPEQALDLWRALISGRWSLVDHIDRDGKRFVLARRNPPNVHEPTALSPNERAVAVFAAWGMTNKLIAYELGLAPSTVSGLLLSALRKLRLSSRAELCAMFAASPPPETKH